MEALLISVWVIRLLKPEWVLTFYVPGLGPIKSIASITLYALILYAVLVYSKHLKFDWTFALYVGAMFCSTVLAQNTGLARKGFENVLEHYLFYAVNLAVISALAKDLAIIDRIFKIYLITLVFYGVSGIIFKGRVPFHVFLSDEDAYGPFMALGMPLALLLAFREERMNRWTMRGGRPLYRRIDCVLRSRGVSELLFWGVLRLASVVQQGEHDPSDACRCAGVCDRGQCLVRSRGLLG